MMIAIFIIIIITIIIDIIHMRSNQVNVQATLLLDAFRSHSPLVDQQRPILLALQDAVNNHCCFHCIALLALFRRGSHQLIYVKTSYPVLHGSYRGCAVDQLLDVLFSIRVL